MADPIFSAYKTFPAMMTSFVARHKEVNADIASAVFMNAYKFYMLDLTQAGALRMDFFVFSKEQAADIEAIALDKFKMLAILDPFAEALFMTQNSRHAIDKYFNIYFAPSEGLTSTQIGVDAFMLAGATLGMEFTDISNLARQVDALSINDYALFTALLVGGIKSLNPQAYMDGINRFKDYLNNILVNPDNFKSSASPLESGIANTQIIMDALRLPKDNVVFQREYLKNLDLSLVTRMMLGGNMEMIPDNQPRLEVDKAINIWRYNSRIRVGDISGELLPYPSYPEEKDYGKYLRNVVIAVIAIAIVAPYALSSMGAGVAKGTTLGAEALATGGQIAVTATGAAVGTVVSVVKNNLLDDLIGDKEEDIAQTQTEIDTLPTAQPPSLAKQAMPVLLIGGAVLLTTL